MKKKKTSENNENSTPKSFVRTEVEITSDIASVFSRVLSFLESQPDQSNNISNKSINSSGGSSSGTSSSRIGNVNITVAEMQKVLRSFDVPVKGKFWLCLCLASRFRY